MRVRVRVSVGVVIGGALVASGLAAKAAGPEHANDLVIIANRSIRAKSITLAVLRQLFTRRRLSWASARIVPIDAKPGTWERKAFRRRVLRMTRDEETRYWQDQRIQSGVSPPVEFRRVLKAVYKLKGAVGYVRRAKYRFGVAKILLVLPDDGKEPPEP